MDLYQSYRPHPRKNILSTRRKIKVLSALNSSSKKRLCNNETEFETETISDHGKEVMNLLQNELAYIECLKQLKKCMIHPIVKEVIEHLDSIIELIDEMLSMHCNLCSVLLHGKGELSDTLKQLASNLDVYVSYSILINLELSNIQKLSEMYYCNTKVQITDLLHEPMAHISRCKTLFQNLFSTKTGEIYGEILQAVEYTYEKIKNVSSLQKNALRILQIQKLLVRRQPKILSPGRTVLKEGILYKVNCHGSGLKQRAFFLFSDFLLCCKILSKAFDRQEKNSLLCCSLFSLSSCTVNFVMGSSTNNKALFKVTCGSASYLLFSKIPGESQSWVQELQVAIRACQTPSSKLEPKLKRTKNICIKTRTSPFLHTHNSLENVSAVEKNTKVESMNSPETHSSSSSLGKLKKLFTCIKL